MTKPVRCWARTTGSGSKLSITWHELNQINRRFNNLYSQLKSAGVRLGTSGLDVERNEVYAETPDVAKARKVLADNGLGAGLIDVRYIKKVGYMTTF